MRDGTTSLPPIAGIKPPLILRRTSHLSPHRQSVASTDNKRVSWPVGPPAPTMDVVGPWRPAVDGRRPPARLHGRGSEVKQHR